MFILKSKHYYYSIIIIIIIIIIIDLIGQSVVMKFSFYLIALLILIRKIIIINEFIYYYRLEFLYANGNKINSYNIECFASTADLLRPKKRVKVEDLFTITIGYIKDKRADKLDEQQRIRVEFL